MDNSLLIPPMFEILALLSISKVQSTSISLETWIKALQEVGGSWLGCNIVIYIWIWSLFFQIPNFGSYLDFEGVNNIHDM